LLLVKLSKHVCGWCCFDCFNFLLLFLFFKLNFFFFLFVDLLLDLKYLCLIIFISHYIKVHLQFWRHFHDLKKYYLYLLPRINEVTKHYCAVCVLMFWEYYLQGHNGTIHVYFLLWLDIKFDWLPYVYLKFFFAITFIWPLWSIILKHILYKGLVYFNPMILFWNMLVIFGHNCLICFMAMVIIPRSSLLPLFKFAY